MSAFEIDPAKLAEFCQRNRIHRLFLFGSIARAESTPDSDVDLIAELPDDVSLLDLVRLERELSSTLGRKVDLLTEEAISPYIRERIRGDLQLLYEAR